MNEGLTTEGVARVVYAASRELGIAMGMAPDVNWDTRSAKYKASYTQVVNDMLLRRVAPAEAHQAWRDNMERNGWVFGPLNAKARTHPAMVPYEGLPLPHRLKDALFDAICNLFCATPPTEETTNEATNGATTDANGGLRPNGKLHVAPETADA